MKANYLRGADCFDGWRDDVLTGKPPTFFRIADGGSLAGIEIGPRLITLFGGAPGGGSFGSPAITTVRRSIKRDSIPATDIHSR